jgi:ubiquinol-cytochrome c reductase cytochrome b subunit
VPRQWTWVSGILLLVVLLGFGLTGTLLPWDQQAYWTVDAARESIQNIPLFGPFLLGLLWGGWEIGREVLLRFYVLHTGALPWLAALLLVAHLILIWRFGIASSRTVGSPASAPLAEVLLVLFGAGLLAVGVTATLVVIHPPLLAAAADPATPLLDLPPRWYLRPARPLLRGLPPGTAAAVVFALFLFVTLLPFFDGRPIRSTWRRVLRWVLGVMALAAVVSLGTQVHGG